MSRREIFDTIKATRGKGYTDAEVEQIDEFLTSLGIPMDGGKRLSERGLQLIKDYEGLRLIAYRDTGGVLTIGYGHTGPDVTGGLQITEARATELLREDVREAEADVARLFPITTQGQYDALVSFVFNLGAGQVKESTLRRLHNEGDYAGAAAQFARWRFDNGKELAGLVKRRAAEAVLYRGRA